MTKEPMVQRVVRVPEGLWDAAKIKAAERGETVSDVIREQLEEYAPTPRREGGRHAGLPKALLTILRDAEEAESALIAAVGNLDGEPFVWCYPTTGLLDDGDLNDFIALAERLPAIEARRI